MRKKIVNGRLVNKKELSSRGSRSIYLDIDDAVL